MRARSYSAKAPAVEHRTEGVDVDSSVRERRWTPRALRSVRSVTRFAGGAPRVVVDAADNEGVSASQARLHSFHW